MGPRPELLTNPFVIFQGRFWTPDTPPLLICTWKYWFSLVVMYGKCILTLDMLNVLHSYLIFILLTCRIPVVSMHFQSVWKTVRILIRLLHQKPADLDLQYFQKKDKSRLSRTNVKYTQGSSLIIFSSFLFFRFLVKNDKGKDCPSPQASISIEINNAQPILLMCYLLKLHNL